MTFFEFAEYLQKLDQTTKRLEITSILTELITKLVYQEADKAIYLSLGYLKAPFETQRFNIADKMMVRALAKSYDKDPQEVQKLYGQLGDLGQTCFQLLATQPTSKKLTLELLDVYDKLFEIAATSGTGSQEKKLELLTTLLVQADPISAKYLVRIVLGTTRLGFTELTVIDALSQYVSGTKKARVEIEAVYNVHPDIGLLTKKIKQAGLSGIKEIDIEIGVPILPQACQRLSSADEIMEKMGTVWAEYKFDGTRAQLHFDKAKKQNGSNGTTSQNSLFQYEEQQFFTRTYTRNLEETTHQFPDLVAAAAKQIKAESVILDGEAIGYDKVTGKFLPFQQIMQRKRKHNIKETMAQIPLKYFVFDILYLNGESLLHLSLADRKKLLAQIIAKGDVIEPDTYREAKSVKDLKAIFEDARQKGLEGLIVKKPTEPYQAGARSFTWVKLKVADVHLLDDTVDAVVLGYYFGHGTRTQFGVGGFLAGVYDKESAKFKTITKVGTGLKEEDWVYLKTEADKLKTPTQPKNVELNKIYTPDVWLEPKLVVELGTDEITVSKTHSANYAMRFPRLIKFRPDKRALDATTTSEIADLHKMQKRAYH